MNGRLKEPSSWAGMGGLILAGLAGLGDFAAFGLGSNEWKVILGALAGACFVAAFFTKEKGSKG